jgi:hypothetical protein
MTACNCLKLKFPSYFLKTVYSIAYTCVEKIFDSHHCCNMKKILNYESLNVKTRKLIQWRNGVGSNKLVMT